MRLRIEAIVWRGAIAESRHRFEAAAVAADGARVAGTPGAEQVTTFRSAAKPFQLLPLVERGHADRWGFDDRALAVMAASHTGSAEHLAEVRKILARIGLTDRDLACGFHEPLDPASLARVRAEARERSPLYNNCSGKHAGMLALALAEGWPSQGYERADHPVQRLMRTTVAEVCGVAAEAVTVAVDGCSASVFGLPLAAMARGYARLAAARPAGEARERALARIRDAMRAHPRLTGGAGRSGTELMEGTRERLVAKGGAEGLECVGLPERGHGLALKCEDGQGRAVLAATVEVLDALGWLEGGDLERLATARRPVVTNHAGLEVGRIEVVVEVTAAPGAAVREARTAAGA